MDLKDKVAIITGAGTGLGRSMALALCREGSKVALAGRRQEKLAATSAECGNVNVLAIPTDVTRYLDLRHLVEATVRAFGRLDIIVNNAGVVYGGIQGDVEPEEIEHVVRVNLIGPMWLVDLALPHLRQQPESMVVNIISISGLVALPALTAYCASKFGLSGYTTALRRELADTSTRVLGVYPGVIDTEMSTAAMRERAREEGFALKALTPDVAAAQVIAAMKRNREMVMPAAPADRMLPFLERLAPGLVQARMKGLAPHVRAFALEANKWFRSRNKLSKLG